MTEIEGSKYSRDIKIPIFDKKTSDFCFERSREIFNKPLNFSIDLSTSTIDKRNYDKKTRDLIGENLMDIENTLNALNLDFMQAFNELEKTDSAETLFGDHFLFENNLKSVQNFNKKTFNDIDNINKVSSNTSSTIGTKKSATRDYYSPLEKHSTSDKSYSPKDSTKTTPNSFSPQETTALTRGFSFNYPSKSRNYFLSPTKRMFSNQQQFMNQLRKYDEAKNNISVTGHRQRSMSFTENFEIKSPSVIKASGIAKMNNIKSIEGKKTGSLDEEYNQNSLFLPTTNNISQLMASMTEKPRNVITYKPKSRRARNLRRLSYNPLNMINSSSSSSESEKEKSMAVSECDIRSKMYSSRFHKRFMNRKSRRVITQDGTAGYYRSENSQYSNSSNPNVNNGIEAKIYGSNASIRSAPHYNHPNDGQQQFVGEDKTTLSSSDLDSEEELNNTSLIEQQRAKVSPKDTRTLTPTPQQQFSSNFNNIYEFVGKCFNRNFGLTRNGQANVKQQQQQLNKQINYQNYRRPKISNSNLDLLYTDFDVSKLTGKSPTTQSYFDIIDYENVSKKSGISTLRPSDFKRGGAFQWPDKIDGSTVKQNDLIWELQKQHELDLKEKEERRKQQRKIMIENLKKSTYSGSSSSTEENNSINYCRQANNYQPPSPAP